MLTYLATPYSHKDPRVRAERYRLVTIHAAKLMAAGEVVFSPITHGHAIVMLEELPLSWEFWKAQCDPYLQKMDKMIVLMQDGWWESVGVRYELQVAFDRDIPVVYHQVPEGL